MPARPRVARYENVRRNYDAVFNLPMHDAAFLRAWADRHLKAYRRWRTSKRPPERELLYGALLGVRATYSLARERARG